MFTKKTKYAHRKGDSYYHIIVRNGFYNLCGGSNINMEIKEEIFKGLKICNNCRLNWNKQNPYEEIK